MKKWKTLLVLLLTLCIAMSMLVACRPEEEKWENTLVISDPGEEESEVTNPVDPDSPANPSDPEQGEEEKDPDEPKQGEEEKDPVDPLTPINPSDPQQGEPVKDPGGETPGATLNENPLMNPNKATNFGAALSYNIESTGFQKTAKLEDLKGKTLTLYTAVDYACFGYHTQDGTYITSWTWMNKELKKLYGLTVKYVRCKTGSNIVKAFQAMSAGKDLDLITTHVTSFPYMCNILAPLENYCNMDKLENSPGLDPQLTQLTRWKGNSLVLGPCLANGVLVYNASYIKNAGLDDPYELWKKGEWNWTNFKKYMTGLPKTTSTGQTVIGCSTWAQYWYWANTNGKACFEIDGDDPNGGIINNWDSPEVKETYIWLEGVMDAGGQYLNGDANDYFYGGNKNYLTVMYYGKAYDPDIVSSSEWAKSNEPKWVPFPNNEKNANSENHIEVYGYGIGLPRKTSKENCRQAAIMFAELWCNRFTERNYDRLRDRTGWTHEEIVELYEFAKTNGRMGLGSGVGDLATYAADKTGVKFNQSITDASLSTATCMEKLSNYAKQEVANVLKFGVQ